MISITSGTPRLQLTARTSLGNTSTTYIHPQTHYSPIALNSSSPAYIFAHISASISLLLITKNVHHIICHQRSYARGSPNESKPSFDSFHHHCIESSGAHTSLVTTNSRITHDNVIVQTNESKPPRIQ